MAQLIKLENYISRYELDIYRYPGQFIRMKKQRWERVGREQERRAEEAVVSGKPGIADEKPLSVLKQEFAEDVFLFQLRWASSTLKEKSNLDPRYRFDSWLKFFLLRFPDNDLLMYRPVFQFRQASVELDIVLISPMKVWCITLLESRDGVVFRGNSAHYWEKIEDGRAENVLSPIISNLRTFRLIERLLNSHESVLLPIHRLILSPASYIEHSGAGSSVEIIDRRNARHWFEKMKKEPSPLKSLQLKTAGHLLRHCQTVSFER